MLLVRSSTVLAKSTRKCLVQFKAAAVARYK